jgi:U2 small nuclear ribonucleoprotein B''
MTFCHRYPNLSEVRTIPGRKNIAFVEFADEASSGVARDALHNTKYGEGDASLKLKVTFAKHG